MSFVPFLLPNKSILIQPGGQLVHSFSGHSYTIQDMCLTADGMYAVTISSDFTAKIWDVGEAVLIRTIDLGEEEDSSEPTLVKWADDDALIIISIDSDIKAFKFDTGELVYCIHEKTSDNYPTNTKFAVCGFGKLLAVIYDSKLCIFDALDGALVKTLEDNIIKEQPTIEEKDEEDEEETSASPNNEEGNNKVNETPPESPPTSPDAEMSEMPPTSPDAEMSEMSPISPVGEISEEPPSYGYGGYIAGCGRYVAAVDNDAVYLQIIDTDKETFVHQKRFFPEPATPQNDDDDDDVDDVISISSVVVKPDDKCVFVFGSDDLLHICDILSLDELKVIPVKGGYYVQNLQITQDGRHVFFTASDRIISFDIDDDKSTNLIDGSADICTVASIDMKSMVTGSYEGHIRIWDLTREPTKVKKVIKKKKPEIESDVDTKDDDSGEGEKDAHDDDEDEDETDTRTIA